MAYLLLACQIILSVTLLLASVSKMLHYEQFLGVLRLSQIPHWLIKPVTWLTLVSEMCLALGLILMPYLLSYIFSLTVALFCLFTLWMLTVYLRGLRLKCGCFGIGGSEIGPGTLLRNVLLITLSAVGLGFSFYTRSLLPAPSFWSIVIIFSFGMSVTLLRAFQQAIPDLNLSLAQIERTRAKHFTSNLPHKGGK